MDIDIASIPNAIQQRVGLPRLDWTVIGACVEEHVGEAELNEVWTAVARQWVDLLRGALLPVEYAVEESDQFLLLSAADADRNEQLLYWCESFRDKILSALPGVARDEGYGKHVVLSLHNHRTYYNYVADFVPEEGEFGGTGGMFLDDGYGHFVICAKYAEFLDHTIAHELTHAMLRHLPLPLWLNEGVTQVVEGSVTGRSHFVMDPEVAARHRAYWNEESIQSFWSGEAFQAPDEGQELSYSLAEVLIRNLTSDYPKKVMDFLSAANYADAGEEALQNTCGVGLANRVAQFLGPGNWAPQVEQEETGEPAVPPEMYLMAQRMNKQDYLALLAPIVAEYRAKPYAFWRQAMAEQPIVLEVPGERGRVCCVEISILWDDQPEADIRVLFSIDDGGWRAFVPVTKSFIMARDGSFVGE